MLIVGPLSSILPPEPGSAEEIAEKLQAGMRSIEASLVASVNTAILLEAQRCCEDVCVHCKPCARTWMTMALHNEEMRSFYHYDPNDGKRIVATCAANNIWMRLRQSELLEKWKRERQYQQPWDHGIGGGAGLRPPIVYGQGPALSGVPPLYAAAPQMPMDGSVREFKFENGHMSETTGPGKYCDTCAGTGMSKIMKDTICNMCNGLGRRYEEVPF